MGITLDTIDASLHSIQIKDAGGDALAINADGSLNITDNGGSITVDGSVSVTGLVDVSGSEVSLDAATLAALENITVSATDLDIRDLTHVSDSVKIGDGTDLLAVNADGSINVLSSPNAFDVWKATNDSVTNTAAQVLASPLSRALIISFINFSF